jgi:3-isopropylmalate/(R)-2-methylmalate dehydratase small subunit
MAKIDQIAGTGIPLLLDDIDTDRIIPARYLRCVTFEGIGDHAFEDDRAQDPKHPFNDERFRGASILVAGRNFGCGSSREHAPQALMRWGIQAVIAESFAEIFFGNCTALGVPAVTASRADLEKLTAAIKSDPETPILVDLLEMKVHLGEEQIPVRMPESARKALTTGQYDFLAQLLEGKSEIEDTAAQLPYLNEFTSA